MDAGVSVIVSVVELADLSLTCSETSKTDFFAMWLINAYIILRLNHYKVLYSKTQVTTQKEHKNGFSISIMA